MCMRQSLDFPNRIQSPLNYTGGKFRLLPQILPLFPANIDVLVDLFCGGGNVGINTSAERIVLNDSDKNVIRIFRLFRQYPTEQILEIYWAQNEMYMGGDRKKREKVCRSKGCV